MTVKEQLLCLVDVDFQRWCKYLMDSQNAIYVCFNRWNEQLMPEARGPELTSKTVWGIGQCYVNVALKLLFPCFKATGKNLNFSQNLQTAHEWPMKVVWCKKEKKKWPFSSHKLQSTLFSFCSEAVHIGWKQFQDFVIKVGLKDLRICEVWCLVRTFLRNTKWFNSVQI